MAECREGTVGVTAGSGDDEVAEENKRIAERMCHVGSPMGPIGTIEYVYRARRQREALRWVWLQLK